MVKKTSQIRFVTGSVPGGGLVHFLQEFSLLSSVIFFHIYL